MNTNKPERREGSVELSADDIRVRAGFRVAPGELLAGGPIELEFFVESLGSSPIRLAVSGDRMSQRPGKFRFAAKFQGISLEDPMKAMPNMGGPVGIVLVSAERPWHQTLVLNQFIRLEDASELLLQGATGRIELACRRPITLASTDAAALSDDEALVVAVDLSFNLRRDDEALETLVARLFDEVMQGPTVLRERPLALLLSMHATAYTQIEALTRHSDPSVAWRAHQALLLSVWQNRECNP
ncbi:MAG: hypothetical protein PHW87_06915 [Methanothrix sp.]|nr:hypothetical protein [Methanothrix sp.]